MENLQIFVCYAHKNQTIISRLLPILESSKDRVYYDALIPPGELWKDVLKQFIKRCDVILFLATEQSLDSPYCNWELYYSAYYRKPVITLVFDQHLSLPPYLDERQYIRVYNGFTKPVKFQIRQALDLVAQREKSHSTIHTEAPTLINFIPPGTWPTEPESPAQRSIVRRPGSSPTPERIFPFALAVVAVIAMLIILAIVVVLVLALSRDSAKREDPFRLIPTIAVSAPVEPALPESPSDLPPAPTTSPTAFPSSTSLPTDPPTDNPSPSPSPSSTVESPPTSEPPVTPSLPPTQAPVPVPAATNAPPVLCQVCSRTNGLSIRYGPGTDYYRTGQMGLGECREALLWTPDRFSGWGGWVYVRKQQGQSDEDGWIEDDSITWLPVYSCALRISSTSAIGTGLCTTYADNQTTDLRIEPDFRADRFWTLRGFIALDVYRILLSDDGQQWYYGAATDGSGWHLGWAAASTFSGGETCPPPE